MSSFRLGIFEQWFLRMREQLKLIPEQTIIELKHCHYLLVYLTSGPFDDY